MLTMLKPFGTLMREPELLQGIVNIEGIELDTTPIELQKKYSRAS